MKLILTFICSLFLSCIWAQYDPYIPEPEEELAFENRIKFFRSEVAPEYPGTKKEMLDFIDLRFQFTPEMIKTIPYQLEIRLQIDVNVEGKIINVYDIANNHFLDINPGDNRANLFFEELRRVFLLMPNWKPGKTNGKNVVSSTYIEYKKPIMYAYGNEFTSDKLVLDQNMNRDTGRIYYNPQIKPQQHYDSLEYTYLISRRFEYPEELLKDSIIFAYTYECIVDEQGNITDYKLDSNPSPYPLLDSISFETMKNMPPYEPASIDGFPVKCTLRAGHFVYPPHYFENDSHRIRKNRNRGRYYQTSEQGLRRHIEEYFVYPKSLSEKPVFGTVYLSLEANKDGSLKTCYVASGIHPLIDKEVLRVLNQSTNWTYVNYDQPYTKGQSIFVAVRISERHLER